MRSNRFLERSEEPDANEDANSGRSPAVLPMPERLEALRARMAAVPSRVGSSPRAEMQKREVLPVPGGLGQLLPDRGLAKGSVVVCSGSSLVLGLLAAVTGAGRFAAAVGCRRMGLLAAAEMGADLSRTFHVPQPGEDPLSVLNILLEGLDLVVFDLRGVSVPPARRQTLMARVRSQRCVLIVTGGRWPGADLQLESRVSDYRGIGRGSGRLQSIHWDVRISRRGTPPRFARLAIAGSTPGHTSWTVETSAVRRPGHDSADSRVQVS